MPARSCLSAFKIGGSFHRYFGFRDLVSYVYSKALHLNLVDVPGLGNAEVLAITKELAAGL